MNRKSNLAYIHEIELESREGPSGSQIGGGAAIPESRWLN
jgi:hypothetical protein